MRPRIAIAFPQSNESYCLRTLPSYVDSVSLAGGEPVVVPMGSAPAQVAQLMKSCCGVLLPGSPADLDPERYGAPRHPRTAPADGAREMVDELLLQDAYGMRKPILGICYGIQSLNVWRSGTLVQHIETSVRHERGDNQANGTSVTHEAVVEPGSRLAEIVGLGRGQQSITVNSSHHQAVDQPGDGLRVAARSPLDGVIEAIENATPGHFVLGVQWHPERTYKENAVSRAIFAGLIEAGRRWHRRMRQGTGDFETVSPVAPTRR